MTSPIITIGFSSHRAESIPFAEQAMRDHEAIVLEEPAIPELAAMLAGSLSIDEYVLQGEYDFPRFAQALCKLLRQLHTQGHAIIQAEPYLERMIQVHDRFAEGSTPDEVLADPELGPVYRMERTWTESLIGYYKAVASRSFRLMVEAVKRFAKVDARKGTLRDELRAAAIKDISSRYASLYVEAGYIHFRLMPALKRLMPDGGTLRGVHLLAAQTKALIGKEVLLGPGDELTRLLMLGNSLTPERENLLAARSLIYVKLLHKDEFTQDLHECPHLKDEAHALQLTSRLTYAACERLFARIAHMTAEQARQTITAQPPPKGN